jgi:anaerobic C4-dicarboxylate transporter DcuA/anaerobic C4-dicarboxylate transporter DcuB
MVTARIKTAKVISEPIIGTGLIAALLLLAVPVLAGTVINAHLEWVESFVSSALGITVVLFALILFMLSAMIQSQVAAVNVLIPVALSAGLGIGPMTGMLGAASGNNLLASIGGLGQSCILTDKTGSTKPGSFLLNGSFFLPMALAAVVAVAVGLIMQAFIY